MVDGSAESLSGSSEIKDKKWRGVKIVFLKKLFRFVGLAARSISDGLPTAMKTVERTIEFDFNDHLSQ